MGYGWVAWLIPPRSKKSSWRGWICSQGASWAQALVVSSVILHRPNNKVPAANLESSLLRPHPSLLICPSPSHRRTSVRRHGRRRGREDGGASCLPARHPAGRRCVARRQRLGCLSHRGAAHPARALHLQVAQVPRRPPLPSRLQLQVTGPLAACTKTQEQPAHSPPPPARSAATAAAEE